MSTPTTEYVKEAVVSPPKIALTSSMSETPTTAGPTGRSKLGALLRRGGILGTLPPMRRPVALTWLDITTFGIVLIKTNGRSVG